jgi:arylsulfatase A-like enzyme
MNKLRESGADLVSVTLIFSRRHRRASGIRPLRSVAAVFICLLLCGLKPGFAQDRPNVLFVIADDVGLGDVTAFNPQSRVDTPTLTQLASEGMRFTDAHTSAAKCAPSRYSIITGNYHWRGRKGWGQWQFKGGSQILPGQQTLGDVMQQAGYRTAFIGKSHLGAQFYQKGSNNFATNSTPESDVDFSRKFEEGPLDTGFDYSFLIMRGIQGSPYAWFENDLLLGDPEEMIHWAVGDYGDAYISEEGIGLPEWNTREVGPDILRSAIGFIDSHHSNNLSAGTDQPFFLYHNTQAVHAPRVPPLELDGTQILDATISDRLDMMVEIDVVLRVLLAELQSRGLLDNTLIVFTSDNGAIRTAGEANLGHDAAAGFRGQKGRIYEGGHRVPLIVKWGDGTSSGSRVPPGTVRDSLVGIQDLYSTLATLVGTPLDEDQARDSFNILPILLGQSSESVRDHMIQESDRDEEGNPSRKLAYREGNWKLILDNDRQPDEFYDLANDPGESSNLIGQASEASRIDQMHSRFLQLRDAERTAPISAPSNLPPLVTITTPSTGSSFIRGQSVLYTGTANDDQDGNLSDSMSWSSSRDGTIGLGNSFSTSVMSVGSHTITASVTDGGGLAGSDSITVIVIEGPGNTGNTAPTFTSTPVEAAEEGVVYTYDVTTADVDVGDVATITAAVALPAWLDLTDRGDGTAILRGTPDAADVGAHSISLQASDGDAATPQVFGITVTGAAAPPVNAAPVFTSTAVTNAEEGTSYAYAVAASDDDGDELEFTAATLPAWLTLADNGDGTAALMGTPAAADVGDHEVSLGVSDGTDAAAQEFTITVEEDSTMMPPGPPSPSGRSGGGGGGSLAFLFLAALATTAATRRRRRLPG